MNYLEFCYATNHILVVAELKERGSSVFMILYSIVVNYSVDCFHFSTTVYIDLISKYSADYQFLLAINCTHNC